jgi:aminopeptidase N
MGRDAMKYEQYIDAREEIFPLAAGDKRPIAYRNYADPQEQFDFRNYPKGSWVLHMLRSLVGEDLYRQAIHTYLKRNALGSVETDDLREVFEELSGRPLDKFFDQWVYHGGLPELKVT